MALTQQHLPTPSSPSGQAMRRGPSLQPPSPAHYGLRDGQGERRSKEQACTPLLMVSEPGKGPWPVWGAWLPAEATGQRQAVRVLPCSSLRAVVVGSLARKVAGVVTS